MVVQMACILDNHTTNSADLPINWEVKSTSLYKKAATLNVSFNGQK